MYCAFSSNALRAPGAIQVLDGSADDQRPPWLRWEGRGGGDDQPGHIGLTPVACHRQERTGTLIKQANRLFDLFDACLLACVPASHLAKPAYEAPKMIDNRLISHTKHSSR